MSSPDLHIRPFASGDQELVRRLILDGLGEHFGYIDETRNPDVDNIMGHYIAQGHTVVVAHVGSELVGTGTLITERPGVGRLVRMSVRSGYRRLGIGRRLVEHLLAVAQARGFAEVVVETNHGWEDAIALYQRCGFVEYDRDAVEAHFRLCLAPEADLRQNQRRSR